MTENETDFEKPLKSGDDFESSPESAGKWKEDDTDSLAAAREVNNTWIFEDKEYEKFVADGTMQSETTIVHPESGQLIGKMIHNFRWTDERPFVQRAKELIYRSYSSGRSDGQTQEPIDRVGANSNLYRAIIESGTLFKVNPKAGQKTKLPRTSEDQVHIEYHTEPEFIEVHKTRQEMIAFADRYEEEAANAIMYLENSFYCEIHLSDEVDAEDLLFSGRDEVQIVGYIGAKENPLRVMLFTLSMETPEKRKQQSKAIRKIESKPKGNQVENMYYEKLNEKMIFLKRIIHKAEGIAIEKPGQDFDISKREAFSKVFCPIWFEQIHDKYLTSFGDITKGKSEAI